MKKILSLLCIITLICTLCGCELDFPKNAKAVDFSLVNTKTPNYNNSYYASDFYGDEDICLYSKYGSYTHIMAYYKGEKIRILNDKNFENIC